MLKPNIKSTEKVVPMIYAYTTPGITYHDGYIKIGYTEQDVDARIRQQTHTAGVKAQKEWQGNAIFDDGSGIAFKDHDFHAYLRKNDVKQPQDLVNEWFYISAVNSKSMFNDFRSNHGIVYSNQTVIPYKLRSEQDEAVTMTVDYRNSHEYGEFLWNAKPRFGKTLSVYDFIKRINAETVLIVTNRPAIANSWLSDYARFLGTASGYAFVSEVDALKGKEGVLSRSEYIHQINRPDGLQKQIEFVSLQDMKGSIYFGGTYDKLRELSKKDGMEWDVLVIDEAHEGVDTYRTDVAFDQIKRKFTLHLSGTPFKALANNKFPDEAIHNYTYADEQKRKQDWDNSSEEENPYATLPKLNLYTYQMSEIIRDELSQGIEINGETEEYAFDLNEFFATSNGRFIHDSSVDKFLDALTLQSKFPFSTEELRSELCHTFWILDRVESAKALVKKLKNHPVFSKYEVILAAGDGKIDDNEETMKSYDKVVKAIAENEKTITISVGQLTTGVTIPEWTGVLMLSNMKSPSLYMQAAFRAQNPCLFKKGSGFERKENAYVFDFDPARTLIIFEEFANDLSINTVAGRGNVEARKENIRELLNFFPVIGEDENGELVELDAEKVLTIPRKIKSVEVVRRGFMSNFLFQNISNIFSAPKEIIEIIEQFEAIDEPTGHVTLSEEVKEELSLDENGEVSLSEEYVIGKAADIFGEKIYAPGAELNAEEYIIDAGDSKKVQDEMTNRLKSFVHDAVVSNIVNKTKETYGDDMRASDKRLIESKLTGDADRLVDKTVTEYKIEKNVLEQERSEAMQARHETGKTTEEINKEFDAKQEAADEKFKEALSSVVDDFVQKSRQETVDTVETKIRERVRDEVEEGIRDHLRGFSRTIPSFLMAYGDESVTLATFDQIIPDKVFMEVTSISLEQFRMVESM